MLHMNQMQPHAVTVKAVCSVKIRTSIAHSKIDFMRVQQHGSKSPQNRRCEEREPTTFKLLVCMLKSDMCVEYVLLRLMQLSVWLLYVMSRASGETLKQNS